MADTQTPSPSNLLREAKRADYVNVTHSTDMRHSVSISMGDVGYTNASSVTPQLMSAGAGPCIIFAAWNPVTKQATLAHINPYNDPDEIKKMLGNMRPKDGSAQQLEIHMVGALHDMGAESRQNLDRMLQIVANDKSLTLRTADLYNRHDSARGMIIDARTGQVSVGDDVLFAGKETEFAGQGVLKSNSSVVALEGFSGGINKPKLPLFLTWDSTDKLALQDHEQAMQSICSKFASTGAYYSPSTDKPQSIHPIRCAAAENAERGK